MTQLSKASAPDKFHHSHVFLSEAHDENTRRTLWVVALTTVMMIGEVIAGTVFNSMALLADGVHMATHAGALAVAAGAYAFAKRHASNPRFSFGTGKVGDLAGFASALSLAIVALGIAFESLTRLFDPRPVAFTEATLVAVLGLGVNLVSAWLLSSHHHHHHAGDHAHAHAHAHASHHQDNNLRAAFAHVLTDALTSVFAIVALLAGRYLGWVWLDPVMGLVGAAVVAIWAWGLLRDTASVLLDKNDPHLEADVRAHITDAGDVSITDLHIWRVGPGAYAAIISVVGGVSGETIRARLAPLRALAHITIETR